METILMQLTTQCGQIGRRAAALIVQLAEQADQDRKFRLQHQDMQVVEPDLHEAQTLYKNAMNADYLQNCT